MKNLLYKELSLVILKPMYLFALMPAMLLIPAYPYMVAMGYVALAIFTTFNGAAVNKDHEFTASLPVKRADIVLAKEMTVWFFEVLTLVAAIPFALVSAFVINKNGNPVGLGANFTLFGFTLIEYAVFNAIFLPGYFRTGYKAGFPAVFGVIGFVLAAMGMELLVGFVPALKALDSTDVSTVGYRLAVLAVGAAVFIGTAVFVHRLSVKRFRAVNL